MLELAKHLGIPTAKIRRLERRGIISPSRGRNDEYNKKTVRFLELYLAPRPKDVLKNAFKGIGISLMRSQ